MYTIVETNLNVNKDAKGEFPFYQVNDSNGNHVFFAVTYEECQEWISNHTN